jgi:hypothetical protein
MITNQSTVNIDSINALTNLQRFRKFSIAQELAILQRLTALVASACGYEARDEATRTALWTRATKIVKESLGKCDFTEEDGAIVDLIMPEIQATKASVAPFQARRAQIEAQMTAIAKTLPCQEFITQTSGFKHIGLAVIVGEAGDLSNYATIRNLWRRFGLGVAQGHEEMAYSTWRMKGGLTADDWTAAGYNPTRLGQLFGVVTVPLFMCKTKNKYGEVYAKRRAHTAVTHPDWTKGHSDMDGRRIMVKKFLSDLWSEWRGSVASLGNTVPSLAPATNNPLLKPRPDIDLAASVHQIM